MNQVIDVQLLKNAILKNVDCWHWGTLWNLIDALATDDNGFAAGINHVKEGIAQLRQSPWYKNETNTVAFLAKKETLGMVEDLCCKGGNDTK